MNEIDFYGRPLGLGNRFVQIIRLEAICARHEIRCNYFWNNYTGRACRKYNILIKSDKVKIIESPTCERLPVGIQMVRALPHATSDVWMSLSQKELFTAAKKLRPLFDVAFENDIRPIGVHIRGTDRIRGPECTRPHYAAGIKEFDSFLYKTASAINKQKFEHVFVCADDEQYRQKFIDALDDKTVVCNPTCDNAPDYYRDFFALTLCRKIFLASKFSSFSICASLIGNIPIVLSAKVRKSEKIWKACFEVME